MRNVYIIGAQLTGKTTLINALDAEFNIERNASICNSVQRPTIIREVARTVLRTKGYSREDIISSPARALQLQRDILEAQHEAETVASSESPESWYICDRSGLDPIVYASCYVGAEAVAEMLASDIWLASERRMKVAFVILCEAGCQWLVDDGIRLMPTDPNEWMRMDTTFRSLLDARCIAYTVLPHDLVDLSKRVEYVRSIIAGARIKTCEESTFISSKHEGYADRADSPQSTQCLTGHRRYCATKYSNITLLHD